jgi:monovalent cation:H+ antiporter, CPA1 family
MTVESTVVLLFCVATATAVAVRRLRVPYTVALVIVGLAMGSFDLVTPPRLTRELLFTFFLPGLLFEAAFHLDLAAFQRIWRSAVALAVPGVVVGMFLTAAITILLLRAATGNPAFDWRFGLVFGALVAATDPVAVTALFREINAPSRLATLVEAESLFNDGTGIVFLSLVLSFVTGGSPSIVALGGQFVLVAGGGIAIGLIIGRAIAAMIRRIDEPMIEITLTMIAAYGSFALAEEFHASGVLATVVAGISCARHARTDGMSKRSRAAAEGFWEYMGFALNSIVFLLIGFAVRVSSLFHLGLEIMLAFVAMVVARAAIVGLLGLAQRNTPDRFPRGWPTILTWGGLRGALSLVLALSLPETIPNRETIISITVGTVVLSLIVQGFSMPYLMERFGVGAPRDAVSNEAVQTADTAPTDAASP